MASNLDDSLLICTACGTQFDIDGRTSLTKCRICDDPRQFVPPSGQTFTTLGDLKNSGKYRNKTARDPENSLITSIWTEPKFAIGQRAFLIQTERGNILWDLITYLDQETINIINALGGLKAIIISHPHYYTTYAVWARTFNCPVYIASEDHSWLCRRDDTISLEQIDTLTFQPLRDYNGLVAIKVGGHFPGSMVLYHKLGAALFIADSIVTVPSALYHVDRHPGTATYSFMWSIPNMIPLPPSKIMKIINRLEGYQYQSTFGAFNGLDVRTSAEGGSVMKRMVDSAKIAVGAMLEWDKDELDRKWEELWSLEIKKCI
ncbi:beta-lactamase-like protein [Morchella snyderi]|nr:beta-lactamase-like protein [Morchella snyderi]